jgi:Txe/YoeB family toxin of Txe-Axe toxin-antitoxin module
MIIKSKIIFANKKIKNAFNKLKEKKSEEKKIYEFLVRAFEDIENNAFCGTQIPKKLIPKEYIKKYKIDNLWKYDLPNAWRLLYSVEKDSLIIISIILEWFPHKKYERKFNYKS